MEAGGLSVDRVGRQKTAMHSPVNWALLGLVIERPSYAYDLAQRFERRYGPVLALSNIGHVYTAITALEGRGLIEEIPGTREGRQPRPRYRATEQGAGAYTEWLIGQVGEDARRRQLFVLALAALTNEPAQLIDVVERCEQSWLSQGMSTAIGREGEGAPESVAAVLRRLLEEENRLSVGAKLAWVEYARAELKKLAEGQRRQ